jgi:hypothetical protein
MGLRENIQSMENKLADLKKKLVMVRQNLGDMDTTHPAYSEEWLDNYNKERKKAGIPGYIPGEKEVGAYNDFQTTLVVPVTPVDGKVEEKN